MKDNKKNIVLCILFVLAVCIFLVLLPLVINHIYHMKAPLEFFVTDLKVADYVVYYASALSFLGSLILGILTLYQNKLAQEKTDEINKLQLEMQKRSMELAERQYQKETETLIPKFNISILSYSGHYLNPRIKIKNVSSMLISDLTFISSYVKDDQENIIRKVTEHKIKNRSLPSNEETIIDLKMLNLSKRTGDREYQYYKNVVFVLEFSCEDEKYNKHYFRAILNIPDTKNFVGDHWKVEKVG